jgi:hypothetical protein
MIIGRQCCCRSFTQQVSYGKIRVTHTRGPGASRNGDHNESRNTNNKVKEDAAASAKKKIYGKHFTQQEKESQKVIVINHIRMAPSNAGSNKIKK